MQIKKLNEITLEEIVDILNNSGLVIFPFDTCYGLLSDPTNKNSVDKLFKYKTLRGNKPISVCMNSIEMIKQYAELNEEAEFFIKNFLPGPFTLVLKSKGLLVEGIESSNQTLGVRIPNYKLILDLITLYKKPLTSTSANQSYRKIPYSLEDILNYSDGGSLDLIDLFVDAGELKHNPPSTVVDFSYGQSIKVLRKGSIIPEGASFNEKISNDVNETISIASEITKMFIDNLPHRPLIFALQGDMGAGKTHFAKGVGRALSVQDEINSPTFIIVNEYKLQKGNFLYHIDTWRLNLENDYKELYDIGFLEMFKKSGELYNVIVIEWSEKIYKLLNDLSYNYKVIWVEILKINEYSRIIKWCE